MDLDVPFAQKDELKALGGRWDPRRKTWYVPPGVDINRFERWNPEIAKWNRLADDKKGPTLRPNGSSQKRVPASKPRHLVGFSADDRVAPNTCPRCSTIPPWEPQCQSCTEEFRRKAVVGGCKGDPFPGELQIALQKRDANNC